MMDPKHLIRCHLVFFFRRQEDKLRRKENRLHLKCFKINNIASNSSFVLPQQHLDVTLSACLHTGNPKGVMLTHGNVVADFSGFLKVTDVSDGAFLHTTAALEPDILQNPISSRLCLAESYFPQSR